MSSTEKEELNNQFEAIYMQDASLRELVKDPEELSLYQKYCIIRQFMGNDREAQAKAGQNPNNSTNPLSEEEIVEIDGKIYKRVQIEKHDEDFLMDEAGNIYNLNLEKVGEAGDSDEEQA